MDFFATGGFQQLFSELDEGLPLSGGDSFLASTDHLPPDLNYSNMAGGEYPYLEEADYYGIITLDSNNNARSLVELEGEGEEEVQLDFHNLTPDLSDWEQQLLDNFVEIPELVDFLPERTPLCTDNCVDFLEESNSQLRLAAPPHQTSVSASPPPPPPPAEPPAPASAPALQMSQNSAGERGYVCTFENCEKVYAKPAHLKAHMRRHLGEKPYACVWPGCIWRFSRSDELARHRRSHSGVKPYKCDYCSKSFARSDHLTKHRKVHERRLQAATRAGRVLSEDVYAVRPGRKRKNQL
ncbi:hypothetical protein KR009_003798 [Drosophila setifemur]|nr:hypothetical protein KR009_003798 [Drosophila setifemur]